mgnify:FL=1
MTNTYPREVTLTTLEGEREEFGILITDHVAYSFINTSDAVITFFLVEPTAQDDVYTKLHAFDVVAYDEDDHDAIVAMTRVLDRADEMSAANWLQALAEAARGRRQ